MANLKRVARKQGILPIQITRAEIEADNIQPALKELRRISGAYRIWDNQDTLVLSFSGWDADQRPLWAIPEVSRYFQALDAHWPFWLWFLHKGKHHQQCTLVTALLMPPDLFLSDPLQGANILLGASPMPPDGDQANKDQTHSVPLSGPVMENLQAILNRLTEQTHLALTRAGRKPDQAEGLARKKLNLWLTSIGLPPLPALPEHH